MQTCELIQLYSSVMS